MWKSVEPEKCGRQRLICRGKAGPQSKPIGFTWKCSRFLFTVTTKDMTIAPKEIPKEITVIFFIYMYLLSEDFLSFLYVISCPRIVNVFFKC